jgi:Cytochrome P460
MNTTESYKENVIMLSIVALIGVFAIVKLKVQAQESNPQPLKNTGATIVSPDKARTNNAESSAIYVTEIPPGYRDWKVVSVAHEAGDLNDIRAILGNDIAIKAYREGTLPFPEGAIVGRIAWSYVPSEENNKTFGRDQSFVAGSPTDFYLQFMVKDSKKYAATGGWGYSSFGKDGKPTDAASMQSCFPCHQAIKSRDYVFARYAP